jgi:FtsH-binding integral membrane protein
MMSTVGPEHLPAPDADQPAEQPPRAVTIAAGLWLALGILLAVAALWYWAQQSGTGASLSPVAVLLVVGLGGVFVVASTRLRCGSGAARIVLTVLGGLFLLVLWPIPVVVPAVVLQFLPTSNAWFRQQAPARSETDLNADPDSV